MYQKMMTLIRDKNQYETRDAYLVGLHSLLTAVSSVQSSWAQQKSHQSNGSNHKNACQLLSARKLIPLHHCEAKYIYRRTNRRQPVHKHWLDPRGVFCRRDQSKYPTTALHWQSLCINFEFQMMYYYLLVFFVLGHEIENN